VDAALTAYRERAKRNERHREETRVPLKTLAGLSKARTYVGCSFTSSMRLPVTRAMPTQHENSSMGPPGVSEAPIMRRTAW